jgi:segregation and condensation protein A
MSGDWNIELLDLDLEIFHGPFDLLLTLILKEEISIFEVSLSEIVIAYLERLEEQEELDLEAASEFLILMSALMEIKSAQLLPRPNEFEMEELTPEEAREELVLRLITYKKFKTAAAWLRERFDQSREWRFRTVPLPRLKRSVEEEIEARHNPSRLAEALRILADEPPDLKTDHITMVTANIWERMKAIRAALRDKDEVAFDELVAGKDRMTQAVTFFALLEMYNSGELEIEQEKLFCQIIIHESKKKRMIA